MSKLISIIIPSYNEEAVIQHTVSEIIVQLNTLSSYSYELIIVDDGSTDNTLTILNQFLDNKQLKIITLSRNFGHQAAVMAGINHCNGDIAIIIDADMQDPPYIIPQMIELYEKEQANVVHAVRKFRHDETWFKKLTASTYYRLVNFLSENKIPLDTGDFKLIDRTIINHLNQLKERHKFLRGIIPWLGYKQVPLYFDRAPRYAGETKYPVLKMLVLALYGITYFSTKPLKIAISLGFLATFIGIALIIYYFFQKILNPNGLVTGWTSIITITTFFGGIQLLTIGILGEYIGNIFDEVKNRPEYIIKNKININ